MRKYPDYFYPWSQAAEEKPEKRGKVAVYRATKQPLSGSAIEVFNEGGELAIST